MNKSLPENRYKNFELDDHYDYDNNYYHDYPHDYDSQTIDLNEPQIDQEPFVTEVDQYKQHPSYPTSALTHLSKGNDTKDKIPHILDFFGIFPEVSSFNILKFFSFIILIAVVELNILFNMTSERFIGNYLISENNIMFGVGLIGLLLAGLYRYILYEYKRYIWHKENTIKVDYKNILTLVFLIILFLFIIFEIVAELLFNRGLLFIIDLLVIFCTFTGGYTLFSGKRHFNTITIMFLFLIMIMGISFNPEPIMMLFLGVLIILYIELSDGVCRIQQQILKFKSMIKENRFNELDWMYKHMDRFSIQFVQTLGLFLLITVIITSMILLIQWLYPYIMPVFIGENLEVQSVYSVLPSISLLILMFIITYYLYPYLKPFIKKH